MPEDVTSTEDAIMATINENDSPENLAPITIEGETTDVGSTDTSAEATALQSQQGSVPTSGSDQGDGTPASGQPAGTAKAPDTQAIIPGRPTGFDANGNVVDAQGVVVAKAGAERRLFERAARASDELGKAQQQVQLLTNQLAQNNALDGQVRQFGLEPSEVTVGLQLAAQFKRDPVGVARTILQQVQAMGHNIEGAPAAGVDMAAMKQMVSEAVAPFTQQQAQQAQDQQSRAAAETQLNNFYNRYPNASVQEESIASMVREGLGLEEAYLQLENYALKNNLDISKPLRPQIQARGTNGQQQQRQSRESLPNGQSSISANASDPNANQYADPETSYKDIVRQSMLDSGMRIG